MQLETTEQPIGQVQADVCVIGRFADGQLSTSSPLDDALTAAIDDAVELGDFKSEVGQILQLYRPPGCQTPLLLVIGLGDRENWDAAAAWKAGAVIGRDRSSKQPAEVLLSVSDQWDRHVVEQFVAGCVIGTQGVGLYKSEPNRFEPKKLTFTTSNTEIVAVGEIIGRSVNLTRRLVDEPPQTIFPESFADQIVQLSKETSLTVEVWDEKRLRKERCEALLAVARGSSKPPRLVIIRHAGRRADDPWTALVGKGVTFDSGGLSLKPGDNMKDMKYDMAGAATVVGALNAAARLELPTNVIGLVGLVENMPSADAYKLGDVLTARNGKTIEVQNTDAEGRLVLADVLSVAVDLKVQRIVDLATLTGACVVALGMDVAGLMTNDASWADQICQAAEDVGEQVWELPMFREYDELIQSDIADMKNIGSGRWGGAITAAKLLEQFVDSTPWVHLDIAGPAFAEKAKAWRDPGGTGALVRTLIQLIRGTSDHRSAF